MSLKHLAFPLATVTVLLAVWVAAVFPPGWRQAPFRGPGGGSSSRMPPFVCARSSCGAFGCECADSTAADEDPRQPGYGQPPARRGQAGGCAACCDARAHLAGHTKQVD